jgi:outer membrane protein OmpA-like peptidoglycan-associated protein
MKQVRILSLALATSLAVTGCKTLDPYTGESKTSHATQKAAIGAIIGAIAGAATGDDSRERRKRALIGAGVGGLTGAAVGAYMDRQEMKLREKLAGTGVSVTRKGDDIILNMPSNITFASGKSELQTEFGKVLDGVGMVVKEFDQTVIEVAGHTDADGDDAMNQTLSEARASSVATGLLQRGVGEKRLIAIGFGETRPVAANSTAEGKALNRRVEMVLVPLTKG